MNPIKNKYDLPNNETDAINLLQKYDIIPKSKWCEKGHQMKLELGKKNIRWKCYKAKCRSGIGIRKGTFFEG